MNKMELCYSRDELRVILEEFYNSLSDPNFKEELKALAPNERAIGERIEQNQKLILKNHNIDPDQGMRDLARVRQVYGDDKSLLEKLLIVAGQEESVTNDALGRYRGVPLRTGSMQQMQNMLHNFPQVLAQMQQQIAQNPQILNQMSPQQLAQYQYLLSMSQQFNNPNHQIHNQSHQDQSHQDQSHHDHSQTHDHDHDHTHHVHTHNHDQNHTHTHDSNFHSPPSTSVQDNPTPTESPVRAVNPTNINISPQTPPATGQGYFGSFLSMFGYGNNNAPTGMTMNKD